MRSWGRAGHKQGIPLKTSGSSGRGPRQISSVMMTRLMVLELGVQASVRVALGS